MIGTTKRLAIGAAVLALGAGLAACDDDTPMMEVDAGRDSGMVGVDSGQDAGDVEVDGGQDAGPPDAGPGNPRLRLAHLIPGAPAVHICLNPAVGATASLLITRDSTGAAASVPYRGISSYVATLALAPIDLQVRVYAATDITGTDCPAPTATDPTPLIDTTINGGDFVGGQFYTVAAVGLPSGTGATAPHLLVIDDDLSAPAAGMTNVRIVHAIPNLPTSVDVCFDADGPGTGADPVELFDDVSFEDATDYLETMPITSGFVSVHAHNTAPVPDCVQMPPPTGTMLLASPVPFPVPPPGTPGFPANLVGTFDADTVDTAFAVGDATYAPTTRTTCTTTADCASALPAGQTCNPFAGVCTHPLGPTVIPWRDDLDLP